MRILFWTDVFWPTIGGIEVLSARLVSALRARGHELLVITSQPGPDLPEVDVYDGVCIRRLPFRTAWTAGKLEDILACDRRSRRCGGSFARMSSTSLRSPPTSFSICRPRASTLRRWCSPYSNQRHLFGRAAGATLFLDILRAAETGSVCCSQAMRAEVEGSPGGWDPASVIPNAMDPPSLTPSPIREAEPACAGAAGAAQGFRSGDCGVRDCRPALPRAGTGRGGRARPGAPRGARRRPADCRPRQVHRLAGARRRAGGDRSVEHRFSALPGGGVRTWWPSRPPSWPGQWSPLASGGLPR